MIDRPSAKVYMVYMSETRKQMKANPNSEIRT